MRRLRAESTQIAKINSCAAEGPVALRSGQGAG